MQMMFIFKYDPTLFLAGDVVAGQPKLVVGCLLVADDIVLEILQVQMQKTKEEIQEKKRQMRLLEQRIVGTADNAASTPAPFELSQVEFLSGWSLR